MNMDSLVMACTLELRPEIQLLRDCFRYILRASDTALIYLPACSELARLELRLR